MQELPVSCTSHDLKMALRLIRDHRNEFPEWSTEKVIDECIESARELLTEMVDGKRDPGKFGGTLSLIHVLRVIRSERLIA